MEKNKSYNLVTKLLEIKNELPKQKLLITHYTKRIEHVQET